MKNYNEMAADVLRRRDEYKAAQKRTRKTIAKAAASVSCCGLMTLIGIGLWQSGLFDTAQKFTVSSGTDVHAVDDAGKPAEQNVLVINRMDSISSDNSSARKMNINLLGDDWVVMNKEELKGYYGARIFPTVPSDLQECDPESGYGIYRRDGGKGDVYYDQLVINYSNKELTRSVNIEVEKGRMPFSDYGTLSADCEKSIIHGTEAGIGKTDSGYYLVEFFYQQVGFRMLTNGLSEEELVSVITSLVQ